MECFFIYLNEMLIVYCAAHDFWFSCLFEIDVCDNASWPALKMSLEDFFL